MQAIVIRGAREHNLKGIDVDIPRDRLVVVTGLSGSGKSSLAFDTVYAEGQRRYVESLSTYARQFLGQQQKPDVDSIDGLSPALAIEQRSSSRNPRSTVGTLTEIYDFLRLLYARVGTPHCPSCDRPIAAQTVPQIVDTLLAWPAGTRVLLLAPVVRGRKGELRRELAAYRKQGFGRVRIDGEALDLADDLQLEKNKPHTVELVIDRLAIKADAKDRLTDSVELALRMAEGLLIVAVVGGTETVFSERQACHVCNVSYPDLEPRLFSFNSPYGACPACDGLGFSAQFDPERIVADPALSLANGAIVPWSRSTARIYRQQLECVAKHYGASVDKPWRHLAEAFRQIVLYGSGSDQIQFDFEGDQSRFRVRRPYEGVIASLQRRRKETQSERIRDDLEQYMKRAQCVSCHGARLRPEALAVRLTDKTIADLCGLSVVELGQFLGALRLPARDAEVASRIVREASERLAFLDAVGLDYLSLDRSAATLSGGEAQRIRLATQIGSALRGVIYVLDEPSIGLHQRDNARLIGTLKRLRDLGNTVLVVEHDQNTIEAADYVIDLGPAAGVHGGEIVAAGTVSQIRDQPNSLTGDYLTGRRSIEVPATRRRGNGHQITIHGARGNNLRNVDVTFPLGTLVCVTGVSGSGKSTLVNETLFPAVERALQHQGGAMALAFDSMVGAEHVDKIIDIDQGPIGRTPRSNPATYTQVFALVRELFAAVPESRVRGYRSARFSFNVKGGRCEACEGDGVLRIEMHFLPDVFVTCDACHGQRYNRDTLEIRYKGKHIADVLSMTVEEAVNFFDAIPRIRTKLDSLLTVGLGYLTLGQRATTLSGGEAQRIKLSRELSRRATGRTLFILDEPTTGLHFHDVDRLARVLHALVDAGNTVVVIEHHLDVIKSADHVIDLGPEGGARGGSVVAVGTPEQIAAVDASYTGQFLRSVLAQQAGEHRPPL